LEANLKDVIRRQREDRADAAFLVEEVPWDEASQNIEADATGLDPVEEADTR